MDTIGDDESQGSNTLSSSLFTSSGLITSGVIDITPITTSLSPYTSTSAIGSEFSDDYYGDDGDFPSPTTNGLGCSTSNFTASSPASFSPEPSAPTLGPPAPTASSGAPTGSIGTGEPQEGKTMSCSLVSADGLEQGLTPGEEAGIAIGAAAVIALFVWWLFPKKRRLRV